MSKVVITITGPSAGGKSTLERRLVDAGFARIISHTTRLPRSGETNGVDYHFVSADEFKLMQDAGMFVEHIGFVGSTLYGASVQEFERAFAEGKPVAVVVEPGGAAQISSYGRMHGWTVLRVYIDGNLETLVERFITRARGSANKSVAGRLINLVRNEIRWRTVYDWDVVFDSFDEETESEVVKWLVDWSERAQRIWAQSGHTEK